MQMRKVEGFEIISKELKKVSEMCEYLGYGRGSDEVTMNEGDRLVS